MVWVKVFTYVYPKDLNVTVTNTTANLSSNAINTSTPNLSSNSVKVHSDISHTPVAMNKTSGDLTNRSVGDVASRMNGDMTNMTSGDIQRGLEIDIF